MKTAHIADLHHNPDRHIKVLRILDQVKEIAPDVSLITNSGENFNNPYNFNAALDELLDKWQEITDIKPVATIRATQGKHERDKMLKTLVRVGVKILEPGIAYGYYPDRFVKSQNRNNLCELDKPEGLGLVLFGIPHPHKAHILADKKISRDEANAAVNAQMIQVYNRCGALRAEYPDIPALAIGHGVVRGKNTSEIKALSADIYSSEADILKMGCDFHAWGHYHNPVEFELIRGGYLGSFAWDFNELDYKPAITIFDWDSMTASRHELDINIKRKLIMFPGDAIPDLTGCDVHLVNNQTEWTEADCKDKGAGLIKVTTEIEKEHKIRSKAVIEAVTYQDKFLAVYPEATDRQLKISEEFWEADKAAGKIPQKKIITLLSVEIYGSKAFSERLGKDLVKFNVQDYSDLTMLIGPGGHGKSTLDDYCSPFSVLFLQANALLSTFELEDSYIKQEWDINGELYRIEKFFKPTLAAPKAEYFAYDKNGPISGLTGNRGPFDDWSVKMFGTPRKYATSVLNTQFDDNQSKFMNQPINPSIFQATNIELKGLFHELAGTDLKHLELKCKHKADEFKEAMETETTKRAGIEESIPDKTDLENTIAGIKAHIITKEFSISAATDKVSSIEKEVEAIRKKEENNREVEAVIKSLNSQIKAETDSKTLLEKDLSEIGNIDIEAVNRELIVLEDEKTRYENRLIELPAIQLANGENKEIYEKALKVWNEENLEITAHNTSIETLRKEIDSWKTRKRAAEKRKNDKDLKAAGDTLLANNANLREYNNADERLEGEIRTFEERIKTGQEMIDNIKACSKCGNIEDDDEAKKVSYKKNLDKLKVEKITKETERESLKLPEPVSIDADFTDEDKEIAEADGKINQPVLAAKPLPPEPIEPDYEDETIPTFDQANYDSLKAKVSDISEDKITELRTKITESGKRIADLELQVKQQIISEIDHTPEESLKTAETTLKTLTDELSNLRTDVIRNQDKIDDINRQREALKEYDKRIADYEKDYLFWDDMKIKWGPKGIPARILEHTGPYIDQLANEVLAKYYPVYKIHSETTKMDSTGKKELEIFQISAINQETGREKPINALSGEERSFVKAALREAFRELNKQNSLEKWMVLFEDEPDAHVSSDYIQEFWNMMEDLTAKHETTIIGIAHSQEIKHRSAVSVDIRSL